MLTDAQHTARSKGLGGSDTAAAIGLNPYQTPLELYFEKIGEAIERPFTQRMHFGNQLEAVIADEYARRTKTRVRKSRRTHKHPQHDFMLAHVDRTIDKHNKILECKTADKWAARDDQWGLGNRYDETGCLIEADDKVPDYYLMQVAHYMAVLDKPQADLAVLIGGNDFRIYSISRDLELEAALIELEQEFWEEHVLARVPPLPSNEKDLVRLFPKSISSKKSISECMSDILSELKATKSIVKKYNDKKSEYELIVKRYMGEHDTLVDANGTQLVTWKSSKPSQRFNEKAFAKEHPELYQKYQQEQLGSRRFLVKEI
jgi:putative phage-type endonuclease